MLVVLLSVGAAADAAEILVKYEGGRPCMLMSAGVRGVVEYCELLAAATGLSADAIGVVRDYYPSNARCTSLKCYSARWGAVHHCIKRCAIGGSCLACGVPCVMQVAAMHARWCPYWLSVPCNSYRICTNDGVHWVLCVSAGTVVTKNGAS